MLFPFSTRFRVVPNLVQAAPYEDARAESGWIRTPIECVTTTAYGPPSRRSAGQLSLRAEAGVHQRAGYRHPGRYPVLRGVPLTFAASIREIWPDGTASISRPYVRLDCQPEETKWAYVEEYNIPFHELGLEGEE